MIMARIPGIDAKFTTRCDVPLSRTATYHQPETWNWQTEDGACASGPIARHTILARIKRAQDSQPSEGNLLFLGDYRGFEL